MTAASVAGRAFALVAPLPFLYAAFPAQAVAFWLAMTTFQALVGAFAGIMPTISMQMISYANAGSDRLGGSSEDHAENRTDGPNWPLIALVNRATRRAFAAIALGWVVFAATAGTLIMWRPMQASGIGGEAYWAWGVFVAGSAARLLLQPYAAYGMGRGRVAEVRRLEAMSWAAGGAAAVAALALLPSIVLAITVVQLPILANHLLLRRLASREGWRTARGKPERDVFGEIWPRAWRGGVGVLAGMLTVYGSGYLYAQAGPGAASAGYFLALNVIGIAGQLSISPVYAALPALAGLYASGRAEEMNARAHRAMSRSMWVYVAIAALVPPAMAGANALLPEPVAFADGWLWLAICGAGLLLRYGANHLHYYTVTNDIRWHVINPVFLILSLGPFLVLPWNDPFLFMIAQGAAALLFYSSYSRWLTLRRLRYPLDKDLGDLLFPALVMSAALLAWAWIGLI